MQKAGHIGQVTSTRVMAETGYLVTSQVVRNSSLLRALTGYNIIWKAFVMFSALQRLFFMKTGESMKETRKKRKRFLAGPVGILLLLGGIIASVAVAVTGMKKAAEAKSSDPVNILCFGDSLTAGAGGNGISYPEVLQEMTGLKVYNYGVGGAGVNQIGMKMGAFPFYVGEFGIPSDPVPVPITIVAQDGELTSLLRNENGGLNPCYIADIKGTILWDSVKETYTFTREQSGEAVMVPARTRVQTDAMRRSTDNDIYVIYVGTNNFPDKRSVDELIDSINEMVTEIKTQKYIVVGMTSKTYVDDIVRVNRDMRLEFGDHFLDIRTYMIEHGLEDAGLEATTQDIYDMDTGEIPASLRSDLVHGNEYFYRILGEQLYEKMQDLGYIVVE